MPFASSLKSAATRGPDRVAVRVAGGEVTRDELVTLVNQLGANLTSLGVSPGDTVVLLLPNSLAFVGLFHAVLAVDSIVVPIQSTSTMQEIARVLVDCQPALLVTVNELSVRAQDAAVRSGRSLTVALADRGARDKLRVVTPGQVVESEPWPTQGTTGGGVILYTSGTSGRPRGVFFDETNVEANVEAVVEATDLREDDVSVVFLPLAHSFAQNVAMNATLIAGGELIVLDGFYPRGVWAAVAEHRATRLYGVPATYDALIRFRNDGATPPHLRYCLSAGDRLSAELAARFADVVSLELFNGYGLTEAGFVTCARSISDRGTAGRALAGVSLSLADVGAHDMPDVGEVVVAGGGAMRGYWDPATRAPAVPPPTGFRTGDLGWIDDDGRLTVMGRLKSMIKISGRSVVPEEVERILRDHPAVADARVYGVDHDRIGAMVVADVVARGIHRVNQDELRAHCAAQLSAYKIPTTIQFLDSVGRNELGKASRDADANVSTGPSPLQT